MRTPAERVLALVPQLYVDEESDAVLEALIGAWTIGLERPAEVAYGVDARTVAWAVLTDPGVAPLWALPHAALYTGGTMPLRLAGESDEDYLLRARDAVVLPRGMKRGAWSALRAAIRTHLTGSKFVSITEWVDDNPFKLGARVRDDECPDPAVVRATANADDAIPAGMKVEIVLASGPLWDEANVAWDATTGAWDDNNIGG